MERAVAYAVLASELDRWQQLSHAEIKRLVGTTISKRATVGQEQVEIDVEIRWHDVQRQQVEVKVTARGPSCWNMERLEERVLVPCNENISSSPSCAR